MAVCVLYFDGVLRLRWNKFAKPGDEYGVARHYYGREVARCPVHAHADPEVFWYVEGAGQHEINGRKHLHARGDLVFVRPDDRHSLRITRQQDFTIINVTFSADHLDRLSLSYEHMISRYWPREGDPIIRHLGNEPLSTLDAWAADLVAGDRTIFALDRFLLNLCHLARTPAESSAAGQLLTTDRPTSRIVYECGYESLSYFYRLFRERFGTSPRQYRLTPKLK